MALELAQPKKMNVVDIIRKDVETNNPEITSEEGINIYKNFVKKGLRIIRIRNTLFVIMSNDNGVVFYHTINADNLKNYLENAVNFYSLMKKEGNMASITYFSSDKTLKLCQLYKLGTEIIQESDDPKKGKYMLITYLNVGSK
jgi:DNA-binding cell septation regulator SpoVG